jgi:hypothetical protein
MDKPVLAVFSDPNFFSVHLVENLLSKSCDIFIFTLDTDGWEENTKHISFKSNLHITNEKNFRVGAQITYAIFCYGFTDQKTAYANFRVHFKKEYFANTKSLAIFPYEIFTDKENSQIPIDHNLAVIYTGNLFSPRMEVGGGLRASQIVREVVEKKNISLVVGETFYPAFAPHVAKQVSKWVFSFGPYGKEVFLVGEEISGDGLGRELQKLIPDIKVSYREGEIPKTVPRGFPRETLSSNLAFLLRESLVGVAKNIKVLRTKNEPEVRMNKKSRLMILFLTLIFTVPFMFSLISGLFLATSYKLYLSGYSDLSNSLTIFSKMLATAGRVESSTFRGIPVFGGLYNEVDFTLYLEEKAADIALNAIPAIEVSKEFMGRVLGNEVYDPENLSKKLSVHLDYIYKVVSVVDLETSEEASKGGVIAAKLLQKVDFEKVKKLTSSGAKISEDLPSILGKDSRKTYLVLFQNNTELRPTGGFIGSFALLTFEGGRMSDFSVSDVYSADGQLKGHIEPPAPIKTHLGEASWFLRDSNWDPDFPTSAKRAEWFIDKEIDRQVEGVIALDLRPVKDFLKYTGNIFLPDYDLDITSENLYEKTQAEVHENFFPGTHKKASFLTALSRNLVTTLSSLKDSQKTGVLRAVFENFESRHIQVYLHNERVQETLSGLGWAGEVARPSCGDNCYSDFIGLVEANVGVNKANYFISREQEIGINVNGDKIDRELSINFVNSANPSLGAPAKYKAYVRVLVPEDAEPQGNFDITESRGLKEVGFLVEVLAGQSKAYRISWSSPISSSESYGLFVRKQAGTEEKDKLSVVMGGEVVYNSNLVKDIWIQKP